MEKKKQVKKEEMTQKEFKEMNDFHKIEVVFYKSCAMCQNSRVVKNPSKMVKFDLLVCTLVEPAFVVDAGTVCDEYK